MPPVHDIGTSSQRPLSVFDVGTKVLNVDRQDIRFNTESSTQAAQCFSRSKLVHFFFFFTLARLPLMCIIGLFSLLPEKKKKMKNPFRHLAAAAEVRKYKGTATTATFL